MKSKIKGKSAAAALLILLMCALLSATLPAMAEPDEIPGDDDVHHMLEKSLSLAEIDKEMARIAEEKQQLLDSMSETDAEMAAQALKLEDKREQAGKVLRTYYMGEHDALFASLLTSDSWTRFFTILDYIDLIVSHDKQILEKYIGEYRSLQERYAAQETKQIELLAMENKLKLQRQRVVELERDLAEQLAGRSDSERILLLMKELNTFWEAEGLSEVRTYFKALSSAMGNLPEWVQDNKDLLQIKGFQYTITVPEDRLNQFLREQDQVFNDFAFRFEEGNITASGKRDNIEIAISGHYSVQDEPKNGIIFHVDELLFNGFTLPDTTRASLEKEFDLGFYPGLMISFLKAKEVELKDGELIIRLAVSL
ncbi:coiled-coil domain-containing protein [Paenibacillus sp. CAU 1782]